MRAAACVLAAVVAATLTSCEVYSYGSSRHDYGPSFARVPGYQPGGQPYNSSWSRFDYRNYYGTGRPGPEKYP